MPTRKSGNEKAGPGRCGYLRQIVLHLLISALMAVTVFSCGRRSQLPAWGLPEDLPDYMAQLTALELPAAVTHLDWVTGNLKELNISGTAITSIARIPWGLERLNVSYLNVSRLPPLPPSLRELDISFTHVRGPWRLPKHLESVSLGGGEVLTLKGLNSSLLELNLKQVSNLTSLEGLPPVLQSLSISGSPDFQELTGLPPRLKSLTLKSTDFRTLKNLPTTLRSLTLENNLDMEVEIPRFLLDLRVRGQRGVLPIDQLLFVNDLEVPALPAILPPFLRSLHIGGNRRRPLPQSLTKLQWPEGDNLCALPCGLKHIHIQGSELSTLECLPSCLVSGLVFLDLSGTRIALQQLPKGLQSLRFQFYPKRQITGLRSRLPRLRELDVSGSMSLARIDELPEHLEHLDISETVIASLPPLPASLRELDVSNTPIKSLAGLNEGLTKLVLHAGQLASLKGMPKSIRALSFVEAQ